MSHRFWLCCSVLGMACVTPTPPPTTSQLEGVFRGPIGASVVLQVNGGDDISLTIPVFGPGNPYNEIKFTFATPLDNTASYQVTILTQPPEMSCRVYTGATGTVGGTHAPIRVGCERRFDLSSRSSDDHTLATFFESTEPSIGGADIAVGNSSLGYGEGRFVTFSSSARGLGGSSGQHRQIFWRDRYTDELRLISASAAGVEGDANSFNPVLSANGLWVVFQSEATNLVSGDANHLSDIFLWNAEGFTPLKRISLGSSGLEADGASTQPSINGDGTVVAFTSSATNMVQGVIGTGTVNVIRRVVATGDMTLISKDQSGRGVGGAWPSLSEDGKRLAFWSYALVTPTDTNNLWDIFVYDDDALTITRVSLSNGGGERNQGDDSSSRVVAPTISGNGRFVAYATTSTNVVQGDTNQLQDVFVVDTMTTTTQRISVATSGAEANAACPMGQGERVGLSFDGTWVAFTSTATNLGAPVTTTGIGNVFLHNRTTGETRAVTQQRAGTVGPVSLSRKAAYAAFGAGTELDGRFVSTGIFNAFTETGRSFFWIE